jgi:threonine/homoserine/homoserine lactone efflux protein
MAHSFLTFVAASIVVLVIPGPAVLYIATRSATQGRAAGLMSVAGVVTGGLVHVIAAVAGVSVLLLRSATAMQYVRWFGAAYLIYLGIQRFRSASQPATNVNEKRATLWALYRDGVVVNVLNPKTAIFFVAFLPQFVTADGGPVVRQLALLGLTFISLAAITDSTYAILAASVRKAIGNRPDLQRRAAFASGAVYIGMGAFAAAGGVKAGK